MIAARNLVRRAVAPVEPALLARAPMPGFTPPLASLSGISAGPIVQREPEAETDGPPAGLRAASTFGATPGGTPTPSLSPQADPVPLAAPTFATAPPQPGKATTKAHFCGPKGTSFVPEAPFGYDFGTACQAHDLCYGKGSTTSRLVCDAQFYADMAALCGNYEKPAECRGFATTYFSFVRQYGWMFYEGKGAKWP